MGVSVQPLYPSRRRSLIAVFSVRGQLIQAVEVSHATVQSGSYMFQFESRPLWTLVIALSWSLLPRAQPHLT
jgi:hypothetical protein